MHVTTRLKQIRGERSVKQIAEVAGLNQATVRQIEQGRLIPRDVHLPPLERAYGVPWVEWYDPIGVGALQTGDSA